MIKNKALNKLKYLTARIVDKNPFLTYLIFKYLHHLRFLFPTEKDYFGLLKIFPKDFQGDFLDIGGNFGQSTMSFRQLGFNKNKIYVFEPNKNIRKKLEFLNKIYNNIYFYEFGLSNKNENNVLYTPMRKGKTYDAISSFQKELVLDQINTQYPNHKNQFILTSQICELKEFDTLNINTEPKFIKIDVEGYEKLVILGMINAIKKYKPVILVEYNQENFTSIYKILENWYNIFFYDLESDDLKIISKNDLKKIFYGNSFGYFSIRNLYLIPKNFKFV